MDIGFRSRTAQSSAFQPSMLASALYPAVPVGSFFFHTAEEEQPWLSVDLGSVQSVGTIRVWNREDVGAAGAMRAVPLVISASNDGQVWEEIARWEASFGGRLSGNPLTVAFRAGLQARYLRFQCNRPTSLHLDYVEILQMQPELQFGIIYNLHRDGTHSVGDYVHIYNSGFFSGCSTALQDISLLAKHGIDIAGIDFAGSFRFFKDQPDADIYPILFRRTPTDAVLLAQLGSLDFHFSDVHKHYETLSLATLQKAAYRFFAPSDAVLAAERQLLERSGLDPEQAISIVYRGTDKGTEVTLAPIEDYIAAAAAIKQREPHLKVFIQTDQQQARDAVIQHFRDDCIYFEDLPVTASATVIHLLPEFGGSNEKVEFSIRFLAVILIAARCRHVVLHTGNVGAWAAFYRGTAHNLVQFDASGELVSPPAPSLDTRLTLTFGRSGNAAPFLGAGWAAPDQESNWALGRESVILLPAPSPRAPMRVTLEAFPLSTPKLPTRQRMIVMVGGVSVGAAEFKSADIRTVSFDIDADVFEDAAQLPLVLRFPDAISPASIGRGDDQQVLSLAFLRLWFEPRSDGAGETHQSGEENTPG